MTLAVLFWISAILVTYAYAGYPALVAVLSRLRGRSPHSGDVADPLTVVIAALNEQDRIQARIHDILDQDYPADRLSVIVVSDGSSDATARRADIGDPRVTVIDLPHNGGKAAALNAAMARVRTPIVAFTDARQRFAPGALRALVAAFADPAVGAVSGELAIAPAHAGRTTHATGLYWRIEKRLRIDEARLGWLHGVTGAIHAVRTGLFKPMPGGTILDDMWIPFQVLLSGHRIWMSRDAVALDNESAGSGEEFRRKLRTLAGNWQLMVRLPQIMNPLRNPVFAAWFSHKLLRLLAPWALLAMLLACFLIPGGFFRAALWLQLGAYAAAALALLLPRLAKRVPLLAAAGTFLMLNAAALASLPVSIASRPSRLWKKH